MAASSPIASHTDKEDVNVGGDGTGNDGDAPPPTSSPRRRSAFFNNPRFALERTDTMITIGKLKLRGKTDDLPQ